MAYEFYVSIQGNKQGKFKGDLDAKGKTSKIRGLAFHYEVTLPTDASTGLAIGKRQHSPVTFVKQWGASSPQLFAAVTANERLDSVLFEFVQTDRNGQEVITHTVKLENARITAMKQDVKGFVGVPDAHDLEEIAFVFDTIEMTNLTDGKTAISDDWTGPGSGVSGADGGASAASGGAAAASQVAFGDAGNGGGETKVSSVGVGAISVQEPYGGIVGADVEKISQTRLGRIPRSG